MIVNVILGHPDKKSFNHAIAKIVINELKKNGHEIIFHDLYQEKFDPLLIQEDFVPADDIKEPIKQYCHEISQADAIVIIHSNWSGQPPAILKGWVDKVLTRRSVVRLKEDICPDFLQR